ncbi:linoleate 13S-lipoxygenase 2-1, chloroplastic-like [Prosopis cineraria]|uniref:linoleate 13S-lipoxygenase 2-1, chloroplastic-like n=1 Tax=Prosopis cineraria TaxID=364024 RepID=UPI00240FEEED|nr:linoleate 13S-lipoxygenase 2-1, chloroplastic-like [Prosopis cineraria]XP_054799529.1 linoleate 13S-lipoxygenase 2-1, chloroplastic-like [Prosopis cineraria]
MENHWKVKGTARVSKLKDLFGKSLWIELVHPAPDTTTTIKGEARRRGKTDNQIFLYDTSFEIPRDHSGEVGAVLVRNDHHNEMFLRDILLDGFPQGPLRFTCDSWIQPSLPRVFFSNKLSYLPSETPSSLKRLREEELVAVRGSGDGERKSSDRIYDYDVYNDLGNPDSNIDLARPILGGSLHPYPRRCRTGRKPSSTDPSSETRSSSVYVPRDEAFSETKQTQFTTTTICAVVSALIQSLDVVLTDQDLGFLTFLEIDMLFKDGFKVPPLKNGGNGCIPNLIKAVSDSQQALRFEAPDTFNRDRFFWFSDEEFARETLAGVNPCSIKMVKEWPLTSKLNPSIYGSPESAITRDVIEQQISGYTTVEKAIGEKKLFIIDYHDLLLPYVSKVRQLEGRTLYGSRTVFFLTAQGTLKPLAIELTRPPMDGKPLWRQVFTPSGGSTNLWLWRLAKAHVLAHDSGVHELISHWLRSHCAVEPFVIATNRQLSAMHPIYRLLHPHLRYTLQINALARQVLISASGIIEISFSTGKYSMEFSSVAYDQLWRFDLQALPNDLIDRGMAEEDPNAPHGLKLTIEDYPFANDGLLIWDALKQWFTDYVTHYYPNPSLIESDEELQAWWTEIRMVGHGDKKNEPWWPNLQTPQDLIQILTTVAWLASAHHASVNFAQYAYGGYFPNRPSIARNKMPTEDTSKEEWERFLKDPAQFLLESFPSQIQATVVMAILYLLSDHSPDEEYIGQKIEPSWAEDPTIEAAFGRFNGRLKEIEEIIDARNGDEKLKNRNGAGIVPYELMKPFSGPGVTGKGIPNSISI